MNDIKTIIYRIKTKYCMCANNTEYYNKYRSTDVGKVLFKDGGPAFNYRKNIGKNLMYDIYHIRYCLFIQTPKNY